jgi:hypothetical protein
MAARFPFRPLFSLAAVLALVPTASVSAAPPDGMKWSDIVGLTGPKANYAPRPAPSAYVPPPTRSILQWTAFPHPAPGAAPAGYPALEAPAPTSGAVVVAHLAPGADLWLGDSLMVSDAYKPAHEIRFPSLDRNAVYTMTAKVRWVEDGKWVSQTHTFALKAGETHCLSITLGDDPAVKKAVEAGLAKLTPADRAAAEAQKFCPVQDTIRLGAMGTPVKVSVGGKDVFLCCEGCRAAALKDADRTLKAIEKFKTADAGK